jgi:hypothetical protein
MNELTLVHYTAVNSKILSTGLLPEKTIMFVSDKTTSVASRSLLDVVRYYWLGNKQVMSAYEAEESFKIYSNTLKWLTTDMSSTLASDKCPFKKPNQLARYVRTFSGGKSTFKMLAPVRMSSTTTSILSESIRRNYIKGFELLQPDIVLLGEGDDGMKMMEEIKEEKERQLYDDVSPTLLNEMLRRMNNDIVVLTETPLLCEDTNESLVKKILTWDPNSVMATSETLLSEAPLARSGRLRLIAFAVDYINGRIEFSEMVKKSTFGAYGRWVKEQDARKSVIVDGQERIVWTGLGQYDGVIDRCQYSVIVDTDDDSVNKISVVFVRDLTHVRSVMKQIKTMCKFWGVEFIGNGDTGSWGQHYEEYFYDQDTQTIRMTRKGDRIRIVKNEDLILMKPEIEDVEIVVEKGKLRIMERRKRRKKSKKLMRPTGMLFEAAPDKREFKFNQNSPLSILSATIPDRKQYSEFTLITWWLTCWVSGEPMKVDSMVSVLSDLMRIKNDMEGSIKFDPSKKNTINGGSSTSSTYAGDWVVMVTVPGTQKTMEARMPSKEIFMRNFPMFYDHFRISFLIALSKDNLIKSALSSLTKSKSLMQHSDEYNEAYKENAPEDFDDIGEWADDFVASDDSGYDTAATNESETKEGESREERLENKIREVRLAREIVDQSEAWIDGMFNDLLSSTIMNAFEDDVEVNKEQVLENENAITLQTSSAVSYVTQFWRLFIQHVQRRFADKSISMRAELSRDYAPDLSDPVWQGDPAMDVLVKFLDLTSKPQRPIGTMPQKQKEQEVDDLSQFL